jgi:hypothetical protein
VKRVPGRGPEQRESGKTVLHPLVIIIIILISYIIILLIKRRTVPAETGDGTLECLLTDLPLRQPDIVLVVLPLRLRVRLHLEQLRLLPDGQRLVPQRARVVGKLRVPGVPVRRLVTGHRTFTLCSGHPQRLQRDHEGRRRKFWPNDTFKHLSISAFWNFGILAYWHFNIIVF